MSDPGCWENANALLVQSLPHGTPRWIRDAVANDNNKDFVVPQGKIWKIISILISPTTSAVAGNRVFTVRYLDNNNNNMFINNAISNPASTSYARTFSTNFTGTGAAFGNAIPDGLLTEGMKINVYDSANIDAVNDTMVVVLNVIEFDAKYMEI